MKLWDIIVPRSGLFSWVQIFVESWRWPSEFVALNFVECTRMRSQIIETRPCTRRTLERFSVESCVRGYHVYKDIIMDRQCRGRTAMSTCTRVRTHQFVGGIFRDFIEN